MTKEYLKPKEVAAALSVSTAFVYRLIERGELRVVLLPVANPRSAEQTKFPRHALRVKIEDYNEFKKRLEQAA